MTRAMAEPETDRYPTVHMRGSSATAGAVVLALMLTPVANTLECMRLPVSAAAATSVLLLTLLIAGLLAIAIPSITNWAEQAPFLTLTLEHKLEGLRKSFALIQ